MNEEIDVENVDQPQGEVVAPGATVTAEGTPPAPESTPERKSRKTRAVERATAELRREKEELLRENEELKRNQSVPQAEPAPAETGKPRRADFQSDEDFEAAFSDFVLREKAAADRQNAQRAHADQLIQNYLRQVEECKAKYADWDEVVGQEIFIGPAAQDAVFGLENGGDVIYWLGKNAAEATKLGQMHPALAAAQIGRISQYLLGGGDGSEVNGGGEQPEYRRPKPKLPAPVRTVNSGGAGPASTFKEIANRPQYSGKAADLKRALANER